MRKIILASESKARRKLLKQIGLDFQVVKSYIKEKRSLGKNKCRDLVVKNALRKAEVVARKVNSGVVVGADTVVLSGRKLIGKPKNMKDAFKTIKLLSRKPQWVYTGLAVIDVNNKRKFTDYEKTKVYICRMSDGEIKRYFKKSFPLNKAGSFDIQGLGGVCVERIEGCFYNVVGLPLSKLAKILKRTGINIF